jgi:hypothetical protein
VIGSTSETLSTSEMTYYALWCTQAHENLM